ncbi:MAG: nitroreductase family protein [Spirochaetota bacterium]
MNLNDTLITILSRKSVRKYAEKTVPLDTLELIVRAGMSAPSAVDRRPWDFIIIDERALLDSLADVLPYASMARQAQAAFVVTGDLKRQHGGEGADFWICDCSAAVQNMLLAAESLGLGAVWTAVYPEMDRIAAVRSALDMPGHVLPLAFIPVGYPAEDTEAKDKFEAARIHHNRW